MSPMTSARNARMWPLSSNAMSASMISSKPWLLAVRSSSRSLVHLTGRANRRAHADAIAANGERSGERIADDTRHLGGGMKRQGLAAGIIFGKIGARLD